MLVITTLFRLWTAYGHISIGVNEMKKNLLALSVAAALAGLTAASAYAAVPGTATIGVRGGWAHANMDGNALYSEDDKSGFGYGIYADYNFLSWLGVELGYTGLSGFAYEDEDGASNDIMVHGPELALRLAYPLTADGSDLYLRAGAMYAFGDADDGDNDDGLLPVVGAGLQWAFTRNFGMRVGYDYYFDAFDGDGVLSGAESDFGLAYVGLQFTFGGEPVPAPAPAPAPAPEPQYVEQTFALEAGALFAFDGSDLTQQGKTAVDGVVSEVNAKNVQNAQYTVTGHTDRLGAEAYNQKLSEKRAQAVADELTAQGVPAASLVSVQGMGETSPVTGTECDGLKGNELVKCYAPDRRVEITVSGEVTTEVPAPAAE